jgi:hypothetical protein
VPACAQQRRRLELVVGATMPVRLPLALAAVAAAKLLLLCRGSGGGAEARVLLQLDDFGAVGDGIANDTQAPLDAWTAACTSSEEAVLAVPAGKAYRIWSVQLSGPCKKQLKLLVRHVPCPVLSLLFVRYVLVARSRWCGVVPSAVAHSR